MAIISYSHFTPPLFLISLLVLSPPIFSINITSLLSPFPDLSDFNNLLTTSSVSQDLIQRSSLTLLAVPNSFLRSSSDLTHRSNIADILRYHILLQYLTWSEFRQIPTYGKLFTTLYQTTGRANGNLGAVNITRDPSGTVSIRSPVSYSSLNITLLSLIKTVPYNVTIFTVNSLLIPYGFDLMASETRPPLGLNITRVLMDAKNFNVAASMLTASGVTDDFERSEAGAGITMFVPTDSAFGDLPTTERFQSLPADRKKVVLKFHVLHSYYPLGSLESIVNPVQPTLATEVMGAGRFTLNISRVNGSLAIDTGIVQASITQTVFDQNPVAIFAVSRVLLPREYFGKDFSGGTSRSGNRIIGAAAAPETFSPRYSPGFDNISPTYSPGSGEKIRSNAAFSHGIRLLTQFCIVLYVLVC
ncbi:hypothetical protein IFM89_036601 [Coptis chinensis]|uniref:FAS1 domain-containing protein n=1 Tax=Coptis chinensis TaxID=261450 RepID=A0A835LKU4_9MAGN|nr:hypothetical protein IFM89_036601 [Coptis chinensis]